MAASGLTVALLYNLKKNAPPRPGAPIDVWADLDSESTMGSIADALRQGGHEVIPMEADVGLYEWLRRSKIDIAFNMCEGHWGDSRESQVPAMLEFLGIPYTGSKVMALALSLDKPMGKRVLSFYALPIPAFQVFRSPNDPLDPKLTFPLFVKPSREGSGMGITARSIVHNEKSLREQVAYIVKGYGEPALVERYIAGRELTVGLIGSEVLRVFPPMEIDLDPCPPEEAHLYDYRIKTELYDMPRYLCPAPLPAEQLEELKRLAVATFRAFGCQDVARVDLRLSAEDDRPYILEINPLPGLTPGVSDLVLVAQADGMGYVELINAILNHALARYGMKPTKRRRNGVRRAAAQSVATVPVAR